MEQRVYDIAAALTLEVGKNRMEALGEAQETVDFFHYYADDFERHAGFDRAAARRSARRASVSRNRSVMRPLRRVGGDRAVQLPARARRRAGRGGAGHRQHGGGQGAPATRRGPVACSPTASATPACRRACSTICPARGREVGEALVEHPLTAGITFTGSVGVGMQLLRQMAGGAYPRPCIAEMGGKNPCIVTARRRPRARRHRHRALGLRHGRAEVLGAVAPVRATKASPTS